MSAEAYTTAVFFEEVFSVEFDAVWGDTWYEFADARDRLARVYNSCFGGLGFRVPEEAPARDLAIQRLLSSAAFETEGDEYTGIWVRLQQSLKDDFIRRWNAETPEAQRLYKLGGAARARALLRSAEELGWGNEDASPRMDIDDGGAELFNKVPASDRIVTASDNQRDFEEIDKHLSDIEEAVDKNNEVGDALGDERQVIKFELETARNIVAKGRFRVSSLLGWLTPALRYISEKFVGTALAEMAKQLLKHLIGLL